MVRYLRSKGADLEVKNKDGCTPLMQAVKAGNAEMVDTLLTLGTAFELRFFSLNFHFYAFVDLTRAQPFSNMVIVETYKILQAPA
ncbi:unnamed protein product [Hydatigera taeniaeformis]|uniref:ANK_REP_REGION domain-containing protein n=1 Tax=Hydatigena taeniaeformis TaxID=6205 RepID=A0A0R3XCJ4_HYDTA|nr:unnamed protein product [Hydatigera taeniaeformis]